MNDSPLWTSVGAHGPKFGGMNAIVPGDEEQQPPPAAKAPAPPIAPNAPAWRVEPLQCQITNRHAQIGCIRSAAIELAAGEVMQRRTNEAEAAWKETDEAQKYFRLREKLVATDEEHRQAGIREARAGMAYNAAIQHSDAADEAATWEQARAEVEDSRVRLESLRDATEMAYLVAADSYRQFMTTLQNDKAQSSGQAYREALAALAATIGPLLDSVYEAKHLREKRLSPRPVEAVLPSPKLPALDLDPPVPVMNGYSPTAGMNSQRKADPVTV